jgi:adenosylcobinamide-phosphate synthase
LGVRLGGNASYFGEVCAKPVIGDPLRELEPEDIVRVNLLFLWTASTAFLCCVAVLYAASFFTGS